MDLPPGGQREYFTRSLVPQLFFANPDGFLDLLANGGDRYIGFLWERAAEAAQGEARSGAGAVSAEVSELDGGYRLGWITLPEPQAENEAFYLGLLSRTPRLGIRGVQRSAAVLVTVELYHDPVKDRRGWVLVQRSRDGLVQTIEGGPGEPDGVSVRHTLNALVDG